MLVQAILNSKNDSRVLTIEKNKSVAQAAAILSEKRIGALVVSGDGQQAEGIISERDIVREIGRRGPGCLDETVGQIMTENPVTCGPDASVDVVLSEMTSMRFRHMPVVTDGKMVGLITIGDVVKARIDELAFETDAMRDLIQGR